MLAEPLETWFVTRGRSFAWRSWTDPYRLAVVEVLLQRTRAETVAGFADEFFDRYPDWQSLVEVSEEELSASLARIGLHKRRSAVLKALAGHAASEPGALTTNAPGVGQYIARAVAVASEGRREAMVDSNWVRVLHRVFGGQWMSDYRYDVRLQALALAVVKAAGSSRRVNWAVLDLGATVCTPRQPRCRECPLLDECDFGSRV